MLIQHQHKPGHFDPGHCRECARKTDLLGHYHRVQREEQAFKEATGGSDATTSHANAPTRTQWRQPLRMPRRQRTRRPTSPINRRTPSGRLLPPPIEGRHSPTMRRSRT
jgi:hypothetical protein